MREQVHTFQFDRPAASAAEPQLVLLDLDIALPITPAELDAIERLLGEELTKLLQH